MGSVSMVDREMGKDVTGVVASGLPVAERLTFADLVELVIEEAEEEERIRAGKLVA